MNDILTTAYRIMNAETIEHAKALASGWLVDNGITEFTITTASDTYGEINWHTDASNRERCADAAFIFQALYTRQNRA